MQQEAVTKESVAYYAGCRVLEAVLLNLGCRRDKPVAWLDLTLMSSIRPFAFMHLRYDLIVPGRNETSTVIAMRPKGVKRLEAQGIVYRIELTPLPAPDEGEKHLIAFQALLDQARAFERHWCDEVEMIRLYHHEASRHSVHCPNGSFAPLPQMSLGDVAKALAQYEELDSEFIVARLQFNTNTCEFEAVLDDGPPTKTEMDPESLEFDLVDEPPKAEPPPLTVLDTTDRNRLERLTVAIDHRLVLRF